MIESDRHPGDGSILKEVKDSHQILQTPKADCMSYRDPGQGSDLTHRDMCPKAARAGSKIFILIQLEYMKELRASAIPFSSETVPVSAST
jgi:hypothetical protein